MEKALTDLNFCIFMMHDFQFACDHKTEMILSDFLEEHYKMPDEKFTESCYGKTIALKINNATTFYVEYFKEGTKFFLNDTFLGNSGGHFILSLFKWEEFEKILNQVNDNTLLFFLLLPLVVGEKLEYSIIQQRIVKQLDKLVFNKKDIALLSVYLTNHCVFTEEKEDQFYFDKKRGILCKRNHSERNIKNNIEDILIVNRVIKLATQ